MRSTSPAQLSVAIAAVAVSAMSGGCGRGEETQRARADSLEATITRINDSLQAALKQRTADTAKAQQQTAAHKPKSNAFFQMVDRLPRLSKLEIFKSTGIDIPARGFKDFGFSLPVVGRCDVSGRIEVTTGGNKDVQVLVMSEDQLINWKNNPQAKGEVLSAEGTQTVTRLALAFPIWGKFYLVISNRFSVFTGKTVRGDATVTCYDGIPTALE